MQDSKSIKIAKKTFFSALIILGSLMIIAGILGIIIPAGSFERQTIEGREQIIPASFKFMDAPHFPVWRWFTAPVEVLWGPDSIMIISIIAFILIIGGSFSVLNEAGILSQGIKKIVDLAGNRKYLLLALTCLFFMLFGSMLGIFEEVVALVPLAIALSWSLGWDSLTGLGFSLLATAFGFSVAIANPFSVGVAQRIVGLPAFSAAWYRIIGFALVYAVLAGFLILYAKKIEKNPEKSIVYIDDQKAKLLNSEEAITESSAKSGPLLLFSLSIVLVIAIIIIASLLPGLSDYIMPMVAIAFLFGGLGSGLLAGLGRRVLKAFANGIMGILPGVILIMMAMSIKYIISKAGVMDSILYYASSAISDTGPAGASILIYALVLFLNFFIGSATAKAFLVMPIIGPLADLVGITRQTAVLAFSFGDGFSNMLYPTNPVLLIALGLTVVSYPKWFRWVIKLQLIILGITVLLLLGAVAIGLGPF